MATLEYSVKIKVKNGTSVSNATLKAALVTAVNTATSGTSTVEVTSGNSGQDINITKIRNGRG